MAQAAFYGLGAYTSALLSIHFGAGFFLSVLAGMAVSTLISFLVSLPSLRLRGDYFVIATFAFQIILLGIFNNWMQVTRGPLGITGIPLPSIFGWEISSHIDFLVLTAAFAGFAHGVVSRISASPFGRVLRAIREDEMFAQAVGKNTLQFKVTAFAVSAALAALAGGLYAHYVTYIDPTSFTVMESILIVSMVIIGGAGSLLGPIVGATVLVMLPEGLRFLGLSSSGAANIREIIYGTLLVVMMMLRPRGLVGRYGFGR